jgi:hypothetical protein
MAAAMPKVLWYSLTSKAKPPMIAPKVIASCMVAAISLPPASASLGKVRSTMYSTRRKPECRSCPRPEQEGGSGKPAAERDQAAVNPPRPSPCWSAHCAITGKTSTAHMTDDNSSRATVEQSFRNRQGREHIRLDDDSPDLFNCRLRNSNEPRCGIAAFMSSTHNPMQEIAANSRLSHMLQLDQN